MGDDEAETLSTLNEHLKEFVEPLIVRNNGRLVKTTGDGLLVEFSSVVDAVRCGVLFQEGMAERNAEVRSARKIEFRIGINLGDIIIQDDDVYGDGVNVAARLEGLAEPGGVCISRSAFEQILGKLDYPFSDGGEKTLKNIARPVHVYHLSTGDSTSSHAAFRKRFHLRPVHAALLAAFLVFGGIGSWAVWPHLSLIDKEEPPSLGVPRLSIGVLPLENLSQEKQQDYFTDALTEQLTSDLSRISWSFVISRSTAETYRGQKISSNQVARELNVRYLLEGNVRKAGTDFIVNLQLVDGGTSQQIWSERYRKTAGDMYSFQNEVTGQVATVLNLELKDALSRQALRERDGNLDADDFALRAWAELWTKPQSRETNGAALEYTKRALEIDPLNAEALGVATYAYARGATYGWVKPRDDAIRRGIEAGEKSISLDPKKADSHYSLAFVQFQAGNTARTQELLRQTIALNRNHAPAYSFYGVTLIRTGKPNEAIAWIERSFALSPRDPLRSIWFGVLGRAYVAAGNDLLAIEAARKGIAANGNHSHNHAVLTAALANLGRLNEAKLALETLKNVQPGITATRYQKIVASDDPIAVRSYKPLIEGLRVAGLSQ